MLIAFLQLPHDHMSLYADYRYINSTNCEGMAQQRRSLSPHKPMHCPHCAQLNPQSDSLLHDSPYLCDPPERFVEILRDMEKDDPE